MLGKTLKYDLKWVFKILFVYYILAVAFAALGRIFGLIQNSVLAGIITEICYGVTIAMMINAIINCIMRSYVRFWRNFYKDEAYLTLTLPVEKQTLFLSKVLTSIITLFASIAVVLLSLFIAFYSKANMQALLSTLKVISQSVKMSAVGLVCLIALLLFFEFIAITLLGFLALILGHRFSQNKVGKSILIGFGIHLILNIILAVSILFVGLFNKGVKGIINSKGAVELSAIVIVFVIAILVTALFSLAIYFISQKQFKKGIDIE